MVLSVGRYAGLIVVSFGKIDCAAAIWWDRIPVDWINHSLSILAIILWFGTADSQSTFTLVAEQLVLQHFWCYFPIFWCAARAVNLGTGNSVSEFRQ